MTWMTRDDYGRLGCLLGRLEMTGMTRDDLQ